jgi:hypothetical protein
MLLPDHYRLDVAVVAVTSHELWQSRFGVDSSLPGRTVVIDGEPASIVGEAAPDSRIPHSARIVRADLWMPIRLGAQRLSARGNNVLFLLGRLRPEATVASAEREFRGIFANIVAADRPR